MSYPTNTSASDVWSIRDVYKARAGDSWPFPPPIAPTTVTATDGDDSESTVSFSGQVTYGASPTFTVTSSPDGITATGSSSPITVTGLTNDTEYTFTVTVDDDGGSATSDPSNAVTPAFPLLVAPVFDSSNLGSSFTLSNNDLTATVGSGRSMAPCNVFKSSGKWYCEFTIEVSDRVNIGIYEEGDSVNEYPGFYSGENTLGYEPGLDRRYVGGVGTSSVLGQTFSQSVGTVHALALDLDGGTLDYYFNGTLGGTIGTGISGSFTFLVGDILIGGTISYTANFGSSAFAYTPPSGYSGLA